MPPPLEGFDLLGAFEPPTGPGDPQVSAPWTNALVEEVEATFGVKLPASYLRPLARQNGGTPVNTCFPSSDGTELLAEISSVFGIGRDRRTALLGKHGTAFWRREWGYPDLGICVADTPSAGHEMIMLDYRACGPEAEPCVVLVHQEADHAVTWLAPTFEAFVRGLVHESVFDTSEEDLAHDLAAISGGSLTEIALMQWSEPRSLPGRQGAGNASSDPRNHVALATMSPTASDELVGHLQRNDALIVAGTGVSVAASGGSACASWAGLLESGLQRCSARSTALGAAWLKRNIASLRKASRVGDIEEYLALATQIEARLGGKSGAGGDYRQWLRETVGSLPLADPSIPTLLRTLGRGRLATTNYDGLLASATDRAVPWTRPEDAIRILSGRDRGVVHLHGHWETAESVVLGHRSYQRLQSHAAAQAIQRALVAFNSLVFVGTGDGVDDPNFSSLFEWMSQCLPGKEDHHFLLVREEDVARIQKHRNADDRIAVISYGRAYPDLGPYLAKLAKAAGLGSGGAPPGSDSAGSESPYDVGEGGPLGPQAQRALEERASCEEADRVRGFTYRLDEMDPAEFDELCHVAMRREHPRVVWIAPDLGELSHLESAYSMRYRLGQDLAAAMPVHRSNSRELLPPESYKQRPGASRRLAPGSSHLHPVMVTNVHWQAANSDVTSDVKPVSTTRKRRNRSKARSSPSLPSEVWRRDLDRMLDRRLEMRWLFPAILDSTCLLDSLIKTDVSPDSDRRKSAIKMYLHRGLDDDSVLRFKQIELENRLLELYVDVPVVLAETRHSRQEQLPLEQVFARAASARFWDAELRRSAGGADQGWIGERSMLRAAALLLDRSFQIGMPRVVLEGAPGQGKSTIGQYVCQVHRIKLLGESELSHMLPTEHRTAGVRLPFRVDLRDLAKWMSGVDPFAVGEAQLSVHSARSLEGLLAAMVTRASAGVEFSVADLHAVIRVSAVLLVLDGLDEVANGPGRTSVVAEINAAAARLDHISLMLQTVVTSRPTAYTGGAGLASVEFPCLRLEALPPPVIEAYTKRWWRARGLTAQRGAEVEKALQSKLQHPHIQHLARNTMQLAILLALMHTRGASMPERRTELYFAYFELFLNRESEKSPVVRAHRKLLQRIHGELAWTLHGEAQRGADGSMPVGRLHDHIRSYLARLGHDPNLTEELFTGGIQRVVALVSRVEGTYEFEVQPLREFFAASHLYREARSPNPGEKVRGTIADRFAALARDPFWTNVIRFYAGFFNEGELPILVKGVDDLTTSSEWALTSAPRALSWMMLEDSLFDAEPKIVRQVASLMLGTEGLRILCATTETPRGHAVLRLPHGSGQSELVDAVFAAIKTLPPLDQRSELGAILRANESPEQVSARWQSALGQFGSAAQRADWLRCAAAMGVGDRVEVSCAVGVMREVGARRAAAVAAALRRPELIEQAGLLDEYSADLLAGRYLSPFNIQSEAVLEPLGQALQLWRYCPGPDDDPESLRGSWRRRGDGGEWLDAAAAATVPGGVLAALRESSCVPIAEWRSTAVHWEALAAAIQAFQPDAWSGVALAGARAVFGPPWDSSSALARSLFDPDFSWCERMVGARARGGDPEWWAKTMGECGRAERAAPALFALLLFANPKILEKHADVMSVIAGQLRADEISRVASALDTIACRPRAKAPARLASVDPIHAITWNHLPLIFRRLSRHAKVSLYLSSLSSYRGVDPNVLDVVMDGVREVLRTQSGDWVRELDAVSHCYTKGVYAEIASLVSQSPADGGAVLAFDGAAARKVLKHASGYPSSLVRVADRELTKRAAEGAVSVPSTALVERWFERAPESFPP